VEILKLAAVQQTPNRKAKPTPRRSGCCFCRFADFELKPVAEIKGCRGSKMGDRFFAGPTVGCCNVDVLRRSGSITQAQLEGKSALDDPCLRFFLL
jgi:hypothetical protein